MAKPEGGHALNVPELDPQPSPFGRFRPIRYRSQAPTPTRPFKGITAPQRGVIDPWDTGGMPKNSRWGRQFVSEEASMLAARLVRRLKKEGWSLSVAESCTGGLLASSFTDISGASTWFTQGWVTYSNESKISQLGVNPTKLEKRGAVSHEVALGMAQGAQLSSGSGLTISITGVAGPTGGDIGKPVGSVYVGVCVGESYLVRRGEFGGGDRASNKHSFVIFAMQKAIEAWDAHFGRIDAVRVAAEAEAAADDTIELDLTVALSSINPDLDTWKENTVWTTEKVATTLDEQGKDALGDDAEWIEEQ
jgi:nicotinamide-nucleotide amidase